MSAEKTSVNTSANQSYRKHKKSKIGMWVLLILIIAAIGGAALWGTTQFNKASADTTGGTYIVGSGPLTVTVTEGGSIRSHQSVQYKCMVERNRDVSQITILSIVPAGTYITKEEADNGKVLCQLDSSVMEDRLIQEKLSLTSAQERVTSSRESFQIQLIDNESSISNAELTVRFALLDLQKYLGAKLADQLVTEVSKLLPAADTNDTSKDTELISLSKLVSPLITQIKDDPNILLGSSAWQQLKSRQDDIVIAEGNMKTQQDTLAGTRKLHDANYVSDLDLQRDELSLVSREFALQNTQLNLKLFLDYDFPKSAEQTLSDYIEARRRLERTYAQCRSREAQAKSALSSALLTEEEQQNQVKTLDQQILNCTIKAKAPGLVVYGEGSESDTMRMMRGGRGGGSGGSGIISEGESVYPGQIIISMPDTSSMVAEISVHETEIDKVRVGQKATIIMDAFPDRILEGTVQSVAPLPDESRGYMNPDTKVYKTVVTINGENDFLKSRMSCKVNILVEKYDDVILVPVQVVANRLRRKICYVVTGSGPVEREVQTGASNDTQVQIVSGLEKGETVLLNPLPFTDSASASFQQNPPTPEGEAPPLLDPNQNTRRGMRGFGNGMGGGMQGGSFENGGGETGSRRRGMGTSPDGFGGGGLRGGAGGERNGNSGGMPPGGFGGAGSRGQGGAGEGGF